MTGGRCWSGSAPLPSREPLAGSTDLSWMRTPTWCQSWMGSASCPAPPTSSCTRSQVRCPLGEAPPALLRAGTGTGSPLGPQSCTGSSTGTAPGGTCSGAASNNVFFSFSPRRGQPRDLQNRLYGPGSSPVGGTEGVRGSAPCPAPYLPPAPAWWSCGPGAPPGWWASPGPQIPPTGCASLQKESQKADEYLREIKDQKLLPEAVSQCIEAAGYEHEPETQKSLLRVREGGRGGSG